MSIWSFELGITKVEDGNGKFTYSTTLKYAYFGFIDAKEYVEIFTFPTLTNLKEPFSMKFYVPSLIKSWIFAFELLV